MESSNYDGHVLQRFAKGKPMQTSDATVYGRLQITDMYSCYYTFTLQCKSTAELPLCSVAVMSPPVVDLTTKTLLVLFCMLVVEMVNHQQLKLQ